MIGARDPRQREPQYLGWIASLPCIACMVHGKVKWGVHVAHCRSAYPEDGWRPVGKAEKPHDWRATPLCPNCHLNGPNAQHRTNETDWWVALGIYPPALCEALRQAYATGRQGVPVISTFAAAARRSLDG